MPDDTLADYIRAQVASGHARKDIATALTTAGWGVDDVNRALISLGAPQEGSAGSDTLAPAPAPESPAAAARLVASPAMLGINLPQAVAAERVQQVQKKSAAPVITEPLPGVFALIGKGIATYLKHSILVAVIAITQVFVFLLLANAFAGAVGNTLVLLWRGSPLTSSTLLTSELGVFCGVVLTVWFTVLASAAMMHVLCDNPGEFGYYEAFSRARMNVDSLLWVAFIEILLFIGAQLLFVAGPVGILAGVIMLTHQTVSAWYALTILGVIGFTIVSITITVRFAFSHWLVILGEARGVAALLESSRLVRGVFWPILWRLLGIAIIFGVAYFIIAYAIGLLGAVLSASFASFLLRLISAIVLAPATLAVGLMLYQEARGRVLPTTPAPGRAVIEVVIFLGLLVVIAALVAAFSYFAHIGPFATLGS